MSRPLNLAHSLHLLKDQEAFEHALSGLRLAQEKGLLRFQPHLLCIVGQIALERDELDIAEGYLAEGLALAERLSKANPMARLEANLGRLALKRGQTELAVQRLSSALGRADALGARHLAAQIRLWLVPLLPQSEARALVSETRTMAQREGSGRLLQEIARLESQLRPD